MSQRNPPLHLFPMCFCQVTKPGEASQEQPPQVGTWQPHWVFSSSLQPLRTLPHLPRLLSRLSSPISIILPSCWGLRTRHHPVDLPIINWDMMVPPQLSEVLVSHRAAQKGCTFIHQGMTRCGTHTPRTSFYTTHTNTSLLYHTCNVTNTQSHIQLHVHSHPLTLFYTETHTYMHTQYHGTSDSQMYLNIGLTWEL